MALEELDTDRHRNLMRRVMRKVEGWQSIWMTSEFDLPCVAKGRYIAAKEFYEWLANGGTIAAAPDYLKERTAYWVREQNTFEAFAFSLQLADRIAKGYETKESLKGYEAHVFEGMTATEDEKKNIDFLRVQYQASQVELWHLHRLLKE